MRGTLAFEGIDASAATGLLHGAEDAVRRGEAAGQTCCGDGLACDDAVAMQQCLHRGEMARRRGGIGCDDERPAAAQRLTYRPTPAGTQSRGPCGLARCAAAQGLPRVVGDMTRPREPAQRLGYLDLRDQRVAGELLGDLAQEARSTLAEEIDDALLKCALDLCGRRHEQGCEVGRRKAHPAVIAGQCTRSPPRDLAAGEELVEHRRRVVPHARGKDRGLELARREGAPGQGLDRGVDGIGARAGIRETLPRRQEVHESVRGQRLHVLAQCSDAATTDAPQHVAIAPLGARGAWPEAARDHSPLHLESPQGLVSHGHPESEGVSEVGAGEGAVRAGVASSEIAEWIRGEVQEGIGDPGWQCDAERIAQATRILNRSHVFAPRDTHADGAAHVNEMSGPGLLDSASRP